MSDLKQIQSIGRGVRESKKVKVMDYNESEAQKIYRTKYNEYKYFDVNGYWIEVTKNGHQWFQRHIWDTVNDGIKIDSWVHSFVSDKDLVNMKDMTTESGTYEQYSRA